MSSLNSVTETLCTSSLFFNTKEKKNVSRIGGFNKVALWTKDISLSVSQALRRPSTNLKFCLVGKEPFKTVHGRHIRFYSQYGTFLETMATNRALSFNHCWRLCPIASSPLFGVVTARWNKRAVAVVITGPGSTPLLTTAGYLCCRGFRGGMEANQKNGLLAVIRLQSPGL